MGLLGVVVVLVVVRPLVRRIIEPGNRPGLAAALPAGDLSAMAPKPPRPGPPVRAATGLEFAAADGKVRAEAVKQVGELADKHPNDTAAIIREEQWLSEAPATY